jgi:hypothetical protein
MTSDDASRAKFCVDRSPLLRGREEVASPYTPM